MTAVEELIRRYPALTGCEADIRAAARRLTETFRAGGKLLICGNGGSAADASHIAGELAKGFLLKRPIPAGRRAELASRGVPEETLRALQMGLPAIALPEQIALNTAFANDVDPDLIFAQGVFALGKPGDALLCLSTSGNAGNVVSAAALARAAGLSVLALTGRDGGRLLNLADICVRVPETETYRVQELHLPVYHCLCAAVEAGCFGAD